MLMMELNQRLRELRKCYTPYALEKTSLQVAQALLELVASPKTHNPFLCIKQAARFASQGLKLGSSDAAFKAPVPKKEECTPLEALVILGRAECMQAVYYISEAAFLLSYVADVCRMHREDENEYPTLEWNARWRVIAVLAYDASVTLRIAANDLRFPGSFHAITRPTWKQSIATELCAAREEGELWKTSLLGNRRRRQRKPIELDLDNDDDNMEDEENMPMETEGEVAQSTAAGIEDNNEDGPTKHLATPIDAPPTDPTVGAPATTTVDTDEQDIVYKTELDLAAADSCEEKDEAQRLMELAGESIVSI